LVPYSKGKGLKNSGEGNRFKGANYCKSLYIYMIGVYKVFSKFIWSMFHK
jgi:hypothetical protein